jgi:putative ABC transport system permease protein
MTHLLPLALKSAWNRRYTLGLTLVAIALSVILLLGIERLRNDARDSFAHAVSGTDLIVGARSSPLQLLLYSVFRLGEASNNLSWDSVQALAAHPAVAWTIPLSLGDSHRGFPVLGTTPAYFEHFRYGNQQALHLAQGKPFVGLFDAVMGAEVADRLGYRLNDAIALTHGMSEMGSEHADKPFRVVGILARTGTPVDRSVHISLAALEAIHLDWQGGAPIPGFAIAPELVQKFDLTPKSVTALLVGLKTRTGVFSMQRYIANYSAEPLMAVLPGVVLSQLWEMMAIAERALLAISTLVVVVSFAGLVAVVLAGLGERRRELAILRANGARPLDLFTLLAMEGGAVTMAGALMGLLLLTLLSGVLGPWMEAEYGLLLSATWPTWQELRLLGWVLLVGTVASLLPGYRAYRMSLADGLTPRV